MRALLAEPAQTPAPSRFGEEGPGEDERADAFVRREPRATLYHLSRWRKLIHALFGHDTLALTLNGPDGRVSGLLPLVHLRSRIFGSYMVSMPYLNYGGAVAADAEAERELMERAGRVAAERGASHVEFRDTVPRHGWAVATHKVAMRRPLPSDPEALWREVGAKCRAQVKRPLREGAVVARGGAELLPEFYQVFARNMRDLGTPVYPAAFFAAIHAAFPEACTVAVVRLRGRPVAAAFLIRDGDRMEVPWASSLREVNGLGVNMLLYWSLLELAVRRQCRLFDFGRSSVGSGTYRFKLQWGAEAHPLYWHYWLAPGKTVPRLNPGNPRFAAAIALWRRLPLGVTRIVGPHIVKNLP